MANYKQARAAQINARKSSRSLAMNSRPPSYLTSGHPAEKSLSGLSIQIEILSQPNLKDPEFIFLVLSKIIYEFASNP